MLDLIRDVGGAIGAIVLITTLATAGLVEFVRRRMRGELPSKDELREIEKRVASVEGLMNLFERYDGAVDELRHRIDLMKNVEEHRWDMIQTRAFEPLEDMTKTLKQVTESQIRLAEMLKFMRGKGIFRRDRET